MQALKRDAVVVQRGTAGPPAAQRAPRCSRRNRTRWRGWRAREGTCARASEQRRRAPCCKQCKRKDGRGAEGFEPGSRGAAAHPPGPRRSIVLVHRQQLLHGGLATLQRRREGRVRPRAGGRRSGGCAVCAREPRAVGVRESGSNLDNVAALDKLELVEELPGRGDAPGDLHVVPEIIGRGVQPQGQSNGRCRVCVRVCVCVCVCV